VNFTGLRPKKRVSWQGLFTDSIDHLTSFSVPTHTHVFGNHNNGYGHLQTADVRSFVDCRKPDSSMASKHGFNFGNNENYDFEIINLLIGLGSLMICTHHLTVLTKTKEMSHYCGSVGCGGKGALDKCLYLSNGVSVHVEDR
jgi:hypothetical protein